MGHQDDAKQREIFWKDHQQFRPMYKKYGVAERRKAIATFTQEIRPRSAAPPPPRAIDCQRPAPLRPRVGLRVRLHGVAERPELNDLVGEVVEETDASGRVCVRLLPGGSTGGGQSLLADAQGKVMRVKARCLTRVGGLDDAVARGVEASSSASRKYPLPLRAGGFDEVPASRPDRGGMGQSWSEGTLPATFLRGAPLPAQRRGLTRKPDGGFFTEGFQLSTPGDFARA